MSPGEPIIAWLRSEPPVFGRFLRFDVLDGLDVAIVRCDRCDVDHAFAREIVEPLRPQVQMAFDRGGYLGPSWGKC